MSDVPEMVRRIEEVLRPYFEDSVSEPGAAAHAVIAAIREPTEAMWSAPVMADCYVNGVYPSGEECEAIWHAMIDEALRTV